MSRSYHCVTDMYDTYLNSCLEGALQQAMTGNELLTGAAASTEAAPDTPVTLSAGAPLQKKPELGTGRKEASVRESKSGSPNRPTPRPLQLKMSAPTGGACAWPSIASCARTQRLSGCALSQVVPGMPFYTCHGAASGHTQP